MKTSKQWWDSVKKNPVKFNDWLQKQYRGEVTAASRIRSISGATTKQQKVLEVIAKQEETHASWIKDLLEVHGVSVINVEKAEDRYWKVVKPVMQDFTSSTAIAAHAEGMLLERIRVIADDEESPEYVRKVFKRILKDELFHEKAFRKMAGAKTMHQTKVTQKLAEQSLGLVI